MKRIWLIRHGQSRSQSGEDDDVVDPALSRLGHRQARRLKAALKNIFFEGEYSIICFKSFSE